MNKIVKKLWRTALLSGKYRQARENLKTTYLGGSCAYCCIGVLPNLYAKKHKITFEEVCRDDSSAEEQMLPELVRKWAGLSRHNPQIKSGISLIDLNDGKKEQNIPKHNFKQIASLIQRYL